MLDRYTSGSVSRISPERRSGSKKTHEYAVLGGAGNVAANVASLGAKITVCGVVGNDNEKKELLALLKKVGVFICGIVTDPNRPTTLKHRFIYRDDAACTL